MSDSDKKEELSGFPDPPEPPGVDDRNVESETDELTGQAVPEESGVDAGPDDGVDADPDALASALDRFLATPPLEREGQASEIRELVTALREANALDPLANAAERLVLEAGDDEASLALAHAMLNPAVASRYAVRLGLERDEWRRGQLMQD